MSEDTYITPEGFELYRRLLLPDARSFADVLEYVGEWGTGPAPEPAMIGHNEVGPYCSVDANGERFRGIAVRATQAVLDVVAPRIVTDDDHLSFKVIEHKDRNRALVILDHNYIIGSHWLAYIDPATIPPKP